MSRKQSRRSISVRRGTYAHLQEIGATRSVSISDFVEEALKHYCVHLGLTAPPPALPGVHKPAPQMARKLAARARAEAKGVVRPVVLVKPAPAPVSPPDPACAMFAPPAPPAPAAKPVEPISPPAPAPALPTPRPVLPRPIAVEPPARSSIRWMTTRELARALGLPPVMVRRALARLETQQRILRDKDRVRASDLAILDVRNGTIRPIDNASRIVHLLAQPKSDEASKAAPAAPAPTIPASASPPPAPPVLVSVPLPVRPAPAAPSRPAPRMAPRPAISVSTLDTGADRVLATAPRFASTVML